MTPRTLSLTLAAALLAAACATPRDPDGILPEPGDPAPALELPVAGGGTFSLADAAEEGPVVVVFYRGGW